MDKKLTEDELLAKLTQAKSQIEVGAIYEHYKGSLYKVIDVAIFENDNSICVIYQAQYGKKLTFIRPVNVWVEQVEYEGRNLSRFKRI